MHFRFEINYFTRSQTRKLAQKMLQNNAHISEMMIIFSFSKNKTKSLVIGLENLLN